MAQIIARQHKGLQYDGLRSLITLRYLAENRDNFIRVAYASNTHLSSAHHKPNLFNLKSARIH